MPKPRQIRKYRNGKNDPFHDEYEARRSPSKKKSDNQLIRSLYQKIAHAEKRLEECHNRERLWEEQGKEKTNWWHDMIVRSYEKQLEKWHKQLMLLE